MAAHEKLKLIKTISGHAGAPEKCSCGCLHFVKVSVGWSCEDCRKYYGSELTPGMLSKEFIAFGEKMREFKKAIDDLERLTR